jgi:hypothetical protein
MNKKIYNLIVDELSELNHYAVKYTLSKNLTSS